MSIEWAQQHAGWYTSKIGGISRESYGWCFFPTALKPHAGPFKTLKEAKEGAEALFASWAVDTATCTLCAKQESPGFYTGCMIQDGHTSDQGWQCDGNGNLIRPVQ